MCAEPSDGSEQLAEERRNARDDPRVLTPHRQWQDRVIEVRTPQARELWRGHQHVQGLALQRGVLRLARRICGL